MHLLSNPDAALATRLELLAAAERTVDLQYFIFKDDAVGQALAAALRQAASRGVRVRVLVDDLHAEQPFLESLSATSNLELRVFNPLPLRGGGVAKRVLLSLHEFRRINHRMHNKLLVADNSFSVSGGRNLASEYFMQSETANFIDLDVLAVGIAVRQQSVAFDRYWNSAHVYPIQKLASPGAARLPLERAAFPTPPDGPPHPLALPDFVWAPTRVMVDDPAKILHDTLDDRFRGSVSEQALLVVEAAKERVVLVSPYFIPGELGLSIMERAAARGVQTVVVTNSLGATDEPLVHAAYARYRRRMLELGVVLYEVSPILSRRLRQFGNFGRSQARLHSKMALVDGRWFYIGSMNLDGRSASLNTEAGLIIDSPQLVQRFLDFAGADRFAGAYEVRLAPDGSLRWVEHGSNRVHTTEPGAGLMHTLRTLLVLPFISEELL